MELLILKNRVSITYMRAQGMDDLRRDPASDECKPSWLVGFVTVLGSKGPYFHLPLSDSTNCQCRLKAATSPPLLYALASNWITGHGRFFNTAYAILSNWILTGKLEYIRYQPSISHTINQTIRKWMARRRRFIFCSSRSSLFAIPTDGHGYINWPHPYPSDSRIFLNQQ